MMSRSAFDSLIASTICCQGRPVASLDLARGRRDWISFNLVSSLKQGAYRTQIRLQSVLPRPARAQLLHSAQGLRRRGSRGLLAIQLETALLLTRAKS